MRYPKGPVQSAGRQRESSADGDGAKSESEKGFRASTSLREIYTLTVLDVLGTNCVKLLYEIARGSTSFFRQLPLLDRRLYPETLAPLEII